MGSASRIKLSFKNDFRIRDNLETVTHTSARTNTSNVVTDVIAGATRYELTSEEVMASNGAYCREDVKWVLPNVQMRRKPKPRDTITDDDGTIWTVGRTWHERLDDTWELVCRDLILVNDLMQSISIEIPRIGQDNALGKVPEWIPKHNLIPGRLQPVQADVAEERGLRGLRVQYVAIMSEPVTVANPQGEMGRLVYNGVHYEIKGYKHPEEIWELMQIDVERVP